MTFKKFFFVVVVLLALIFVFSFDSPKQVQAEGNQQAACQNAVMDLITYDNGMQGLWAVDHFHRSIVICDLGGGSYSFEFTDSGWFETIGGPSPGGSGNVDPGVTGSVTGGSQLTIQGVLKDPMPTYIVHDFRNDSPRDYFGPFFDSITSRTYNDWGWEFTTCDGRRWTDNDATETLYSQIGPNDQMGDITGSEADCPTPPAPSVDNWPGDDRVQPHRADRLAVYCRVDEIIVYGVNDDSEGFLLTTFTPDEIDANGAFHFVHGGVVSIQEDTPGIYWIVWNGEQLWTKLIVFAPECDY